MTSTDPYETLGQFPHCDAEVLHAPGECEYCDRLPEWQALRKLWRVSFTGHPVESDEFVMCPSDRRRGLAGAHVWGGNRPNGEGYLSFGESR